MGHSPVSEWEPFTRHYLADGGQALFDEYTRQYKDGWTHLAFTGR
jgi:hypothetical protein